MVAPVEDEHLRPPGDVAGEPDHEAVRVGGGERELPARQAEAARELGADPERVLGRKHDRDPAGGLLGDRTQGRRGRVPAHRAGVAEAEVDVLVAVDVDEARALRLRDEDGEAARPLAHPVHRHAGEEVRLRSGRELGRPRVSHHEPLLLAAHQLRQAFVGRHGVSHATEDTSTTDAPPSTGSAAPLTYAAASESRNETTAATSVASAGRRAGTCACVSA